MFKQSVILLSLCVLTACGGRTGFVPDTYLPASNNLANLNRQDLQSSQQKTILYTPFSGETVATENTDTPDTDAFLPVETITPSAATDTLSEPEVTDSPALPQAKPTPPPNYPKATPFVLENHTGKKVALSFPAAKPVVLAIADKEGSEQMENWITPLYQSFGEKISIHGIAELSAVPFLARGIAKAIIASQVEEYPVILDWEGKVSRAYNFKAKQTNLYVISPKGEIVFQSAGAFQPAQFESLSESLKTLLN